MTASVTLPAHVAVLLFERRPVLSAAESVYGTPSGTVPLTSWATFDRLPDVECPAYGGRGTRRVARPDPGLPVVWKSCRDCTNGRRPLRAGDRVEIVAGELPKHGEQLGDWVVYHRPDDPVHFEPHLRSAVDGSLASLPAPGTVVGTATVEWVGPIYDDTLYDVGLPEEWQPHIFISDSGKVWFCERHPDFCEWRNTPITGHDHLDWSNGRVAVRFTEAVKA